MASGNDAAYALARVGGGAGGVPADAALDERPRRAARRLRHRGARPCRAGPAGAEQQRLRPRPHRPGRPAAAGPASLRHDQARLVPRRNGPGRQGRGGRSSSTTTTGCSTTTPAPSASRTATPSRRSRPSSGRRSRGGHTYLFTEMAGTNGSWRPTAALLDWAFAHGTRVAPVGRLVQPGSTARPSAPAGAAPSSRHLRSPSREPARAPDPAAGGDGGGPGGGDTQRTAALRVPAHVTGATAVDAAAPDSPPLRCSGLLVAGRRTVVRRRQQGPRRKSRPFA